MFFLYEITIMNCYGHFSFSFSFSFFFFNLFIYFFIYLFIFIPEILEVGGNKHHRGRQQAHQRNVC
jgi:hypothetical protein